ncbi:MAG: glycosyltransferase, partial [Elusimicrobia bacterium]|nr:glycosyltransferase [Elusimicrobiota bacterium]
RPADLRFDEQLDGACEDADFAFRLAARGLAVAYAPRAAVTHLNPAPAMELSGETGYPVSKFFFQSRNRRWLTLKNFELGTLLRALPLHLLLEAATALFAASEGEGLNYLRGWASFMRGLPRAMAERPGRLVVRVVKDRELLTSRPLSLRPSAPSGLAAAVFNRLCSFWWGAPAPAAPGRVLFLAPQPFYRLRGMCLAQKKCLESLSASGREVHLVAFPLGSDIRLPGLTISRLPRLPFIGDIPIGFSFAKLFYDAVLFFYLLGHLPLNRYAVVHACEEAAVIAAFFRLFFDFRLVYDMDDVLSRRLELSGRVRVRPLLAAVRLLERSALSAADSVLTNSADTAAYAENVCPGKQVFYDHVPPVPDLAPGAPAGGTLKVITYAGNLEPYQGVSMLLDALPAVLSRVAARCVIIGGEPGQIAALRARAEGLGISGSVEWRGKRDIEETFCVLQASDVLVSPMVEDKAVPSKVYMYMAAGRPIVATDTANHRSLLRDGAGVIVEPAAGPLAAALLRVLSDERMRRELAQKAHNVFARIAAATDLRSVLARAYGFREAKP